MGGCVIKARAVGAAGSLCMETITGVNLGKAGTVTVSGQYWPALLATVLAVKVDAAAIPLEFVVMLAVRGPEK